MSPQAKKTDTTEAATERIRELNERILERNYITNLLAGIERELNS